MTKAEEVKKKKISKAEVRGKADKADLEQSVLNAKFLKKDMADIHMESKMSKEIDELKYKTKRSSKLYFVINFRNIDNYLLLL